MYFFSIYNPRSRFHRMNVWKGSAFPLRCLLLRRLRLRLSNLTISRLSFLPAETLYSIIRNTFCVFV